MSRLFDVSMELGAATTDLIEAVEKLVTCDSALCSHHDPQTGTLTLSGETEAQLNHHIAKLTAANPRAVAVGPQQVAYRETLRHPAELACTNRL